MSHQLTEADDRERPGLLAPGSPVRTAVLVLVTYAVVGAVAGLVWEWVWTPPGQVIQEHTLYYDSYVSLRRVFTGTGFYVIVGGVASALVALGVCLLCRSRELLVLVLVVVGSAIAAALMWWVGTHLGPSDPRPLVAHTTTTTRVSGELSVAGKSPYLVWPMLSLLVLALVYFSSPGSRLPHAHVGARHHDRDAEGALVATPAGAHRATELEPARQQLLDELQSVRFKPTRIRQGYEMGAVDQLLDWVADAVSRGDPVAPLLGSPPPTVSWREGYDRGEVDAFLTRLRESSDATDARG